MMKISITKLTLLLLFFIGTFFLANFLVALLSHKYGHDTLLGFSQLFGIGGGAENNLPTWFSTLLLAVCAFLLFGIYSQKVLVSDAYRGYWLALSVIFIFLSADEAASIHEKIGDLFHRRYDVFDNQNYSPWMIPYAGLVLLFVMAYLPFVKHLGFRYASMFILSGTVYVGGALGFEVLEGLYFDLTERVEAGFIYYVFLAGTEDCLEMLGLVLFMMTLFSYMEGKGFNLTIRIEDNPFRSGTAGEQAALPIKK